MSMKNTVFLAGAAYAYRRTAEERVAFLYNASNGDVLGVGSHRGSTPSTWKTAITNVIQAQGSAPLGDSIWCVSSYPPSWYGCCAARAGG
ncbi:MAG TPA: hypothetical protein VL242_10420 [Sorangium sp.]|nr:hypothetical protein [Sorangium sp.]